MLQRISYDVVSEMREAASLCRLRIEALSVDVGIRLIRCWSNLTVIKRANASSLTRQLAPWQLKRAQEFLVGDLAEDPALADLATSVGLSPYHFARAFKASTGTPPHQYLVNLRVMKARELLEATDLPIREVAAQVGYDDPSYLARLFRREVGTTPAAYRRERRR